MNLKNIVAAVLDEVKRPNMKDQIIRAVRAVVTQVHTSAYFPQDMVEDVVEVNPSNVLKFGLPPRFRGFNSVVPLNKYGQRLPVKWGDGQYNKIAPNDLLTPGQNNLTDVYYVAGTAIVIQSSTQPAKIFMQFWQNPDIANPDLETWAMANYAEMFIDGACARVYSNMHQQDLARGREQAYQQTRQEFILQHMAV